jgi:hypothetical protein
MQPITPGRIVRYLRNNGSGIIEYEVALVVAVVAGDDLQRVNLVAWNQNGTSNTQRNVPMGTTHDSWCWPTPNA